jgi:hypothetical protein
MLRHLVNTVHIGRNSGLGQAGRFSFRLFFKTSSEIGPHILFIPHREQAAIHISCCSSIFRP